MTPETPATGNRMVRVGFRLINMHRVWQVCFGRGKVRELARRDSRRRRGYWPSPQSHECPDTRPQYTARPYRSMASARPSRFQHHNGMGIGCGHCFDQGILFFGQGEILRSIFSDYAELQTRSPPPKTWQVQRPKTGSVPGSNFTTACLAFSSIPFSGTER